MNFSKFFFRRVSSKRKKVFSLLFPPEIRTIINFDKFSNLAQSIYWKWAKKSPVHLFSTLFFSFVLTLKFSLENIHRFCTIFLFVCLLSCFLPYFLKIFLVCFFVKLFFSSFLPPSRQTNDNFACNFFFFQILKKKGDLQRKKRIGNKWTGLKFA